MWVNMDQYHNRIPGTCPEGDYNQALRWQEEISNWELSRRLGINMVQVRENLGIIAEKLNPKVPQPA